MNFCELWEYFGTEEATTEVMDLKQKSIRWLKRRLPKEVKEVVRENGGELGLYDVEDKGRSWEVILDLGLSIGSGLDPDLTSFHKIKKDLEEKGYTLTDTEPRFL